MSVTWHFKGRLIWMGRDAEGHDIERDVKTGQVKRAYSQRQLREMKES